MNEDKKPLDPQEQNALLSQETMVVPKVTEPVPQEPVPVSQETMVVPQVPAEAPPTVSDETLALLLEELKAELAGVEPAADIPESVPTHEALEPQDPALTGATVVLPRVDFPESMPLEAAEEFRDSDFRDTFGEGADLERVFTGDTPEAAAAMEMPPMEVTAEPPAEEAAETPKKSLFRKKEKVQKRRPRHKKGYGFFGIPHILITCVWLGLTVMIGTTLGQVLWILGSDVLAFGQEPKTTTVVIGEEDTIEDIAQQLKEKELIRFPELFVFFANFTGKAEELDPGTYILNEADPVTGKIPGIAYDYNALTNALQIYEPPREIVSGLLIPEGYTCAQIFQKLEDEGVCTVEALEEYAANGDLGDYWFLEGVERGSKYCLEGYLFPATYDFYKDEDPAIVIDKFLEAFDYFFTERMHNDLDTINERFAGMMRQQGYSEEYIAEHPMGIREVVIIASMIEKESSGADESYTISSVIFNRLASPDFGVLQIDATVVYAHGGQTEDLDYYIDSPFNTYVVEGLPAGPISNPGMTSLDAALNPQQTAEPYYYYALYKDSREHGFFTNLADFEQFLWENGYYDDEE